MAPISFFIPLVLIAVACTGDINAADLTGEDQNMTLNEEQGGWLESNMDDFQEYWSRKVLIFSSNLDRMLAGGDEDMGNEHVPKPEFKSEHDVRTYQTSTWFDDFFKDETYLDSTNQSYVRIRGGYEYDKLGGSSLFNRVTARIRLPKTQKKLQLFIGDEAEGKMTPSGTLGTEKNEGIGIKYFLPTLKERLFTNASIGFSGIDNPYLKAHVEYPIFLGDWLFKATQTFKLSVQDKFDEWTDFYFDRKISDSEMIRLLLQRSTNSEIDGMEYFTQLSYRNTFKHDIGFNYYLALSGRTKDLVGLSYENGMTPQEGVYEYAAGVVWRQQLWKNYLFYQIEPILSYHEQYDYQPNYLLRLSLDLYFGNQK